MGGVELHRQRDQLEEGGQRKEQNSDEKQGLAVKQHPDQQQDKRELGAELGNRDDGAAQPDGGIAHGVLHRVARLVTGNAHRCHRGGAIDVLGQVDGVVPGIIVVRQMAPAGPDGDIEDPVGPEHRLRRLGAGEMAAVHHAAVPPEIAADLGLGPQGQ